LKIFEAGEVPLTINKKQATGNGRAAQFVAGCWGMMGRGNGRYCFQYIMLYWRTDKYMHSPFTNITDEMSYA